MKLFVVVVLTIWSAVIAEVFHPETFDYCELKCPIGIHTACDCRTNPPREEVLDDMAAFRQEVLDEHNHWRNLVASGSAENPEVIVSASNMMGLNYDLELEYIARCLAVNSFDEKHENGTLTECRGIYSDAYLANDIGQNLASIDNKNLSAIKGMIYTWYSQIYMVENTDIEHFPKHHGKHDIAYFSQMVWATVTHVGCTRQWNSQIPTDKWRFVLICNYKSTIGSGGNAREEPIYKKGAKCTECPSETACNNAAKYPALCGEIRPAPTDPPVALNPRDPNPPKGWDKGNGDKDDKNDDKEEESGARERTQCNQLIVFTTFSVVLLFY